MEYSRLIQSEFRALQLDNSLRAMSLFDLIDYCVSLYDQASAGGQDALSQYIRGFLIVNYFINSFIMLHYKGFDAFIEQCEKDFIIYLNLVEFYNSDAPECVPVKQIRDLSIDFLVRRRLLSFDVDELYDWLHRYIEYLKEEDENAMAVSGNTDTENTINRTHERNTKNKERRRERYTERNTERNTEMRTERNTERHAHSHHTRSAFSTDLVSQMRVLGLSDASSSPPTPPKHTVNSEGSLKLPENDLDAPKSLDPASGYRQNGSLDPKNGYGGRIELEGLDSDESDELEEFHTRFPDVKDPTPPYPIRTRPPIPSQPPPQLAKRPYSSYMPESDDLYFNKAGSSLSLGKEDRYKHKEGHQDGYRDYQEDYQEIDYSYRSTDRLSPDRSYRTSPDRSYRTSPNRPYGSPDRSYGSPDRSYGSPDRSYGTSPNRPYRTSPDRPYRTSPDRPYGTSPDRSYRTSDKTPYRESGANHTYRYEQPVQAYQAYQAPVAYQAPPAPYQPPPVPYQAPPVSYQPVPYNQPSQPYTQPHIHPPRPTLKQLQKEHGICGLKNFGSSCYINSTVQVVFGLGSFRAIFANSGYHAHIHDPRYARMLRQSKVSQGDTLLLSEAVSGLLRTFSSYGGSSVAPTKFIRVASRLKPELNIPVEQQDAQEFLLFMLDRLHEEMSNKTALESGTASPDQYISSGDAEYREWCVSLLRHEGASPISDLFQGHLQNKLICSQCGFESTTYSSFTILSLPIPSTGSNVDLSDCIRHYTQDELLAGENAWNCPKCAKNSGAVTSSLDSHPVFTPRKSGIFRLGKRSKSPAKKTAPHPHHRDQKSIKRLVFTRLPRVLFIHLSRFSTSSMTEKLNVNVHCPPELRLEGAVYRLMGVINHYGNLKSGHYTALVQKGGAWCVFDDDLVRVNVGGNIPPRDVYVLSYERIN